MFSILVYSVRLVYNSLLYNLSYHSTSYSLIGFIMACAISTNSLSFTLSSYNTCLIKSVIIELIIKPIIKPIALLSSYFKI